MKYAQPESMGVSSKKIKEYIEKLEKAQLSTHDIIIARGDNILFEKYWEPFHADFLHRMYSVTKSFVSIAIGFLCQEGKLDLDDPMIKHFPEELKNQTDENMRNQTVRHMLMMSTSKPERGWFVSRTEDRVKFYFENPSPYSRPSGTTYTYDSSGSFVLGALVERISGMKLIDYLRVKLFDKIGVSKEAYCLECPGGHSWSDSALICTPRDLLLTARFMMNKGKWNGEQILNEDYAVAAVSKQIDNNLLGENGFDKQGYGYQIWRTRQNSYFFNGMGCQFAICVPDKDLIFIYNGDNQGKVLAKSIIIDNFFDIIVDSVCDGEIEDNGENAELLEYVKDLKLAVAVGEKENAKLEEKINGKTFIMNENPMGFKKVRFDFTSDGGTMFYTNAQGDKELKFGRCENAFGEFPEDGYSDKVGSVAAPGNKYKCAASAAWVDNERMFIKVQIIDKYFGVLNITAGFNENGLGLHMNKCAEDFLETYQGFGHGKTE